METESDQSDPSCPFDQSCRVAWKMTCRFACKPGLLAHREVEDRNVRSSELVVIARGAIWFWRSMYIARVFVAPPLSLQGEALDSPGE